MGRKKVVHDVRVSISRVTFDNPDDAAAALERWRASQVMLLQLLDRLEAQEAAAHHQEQIQAAVDTGIDPRAIILSTYGLSLSSQELGFRDISLD